MKWAICYTLNTCRLIKKKFIKAIKQCSEEAILAKGKADRVQVQTYSSKTRNWIHFKGIFSSMLWKQPYSTELDCKNDMILNEGCERKFIEVWCENGKALPRPPSGFAAGLLGHRVTPWLWREKQASSESGLTRKTAASVQTNKNVTGRYQVWHEHPAQKARVQQSRQVKSFYNEHTVACSRGPEIELEG